MVWSATCSRSFLRLPRSYRPDTRVGSHAVQQPHLKPERDAQHERPIFVEVAPAALDEKNGGVSPPTFMASCPGYGMSRALRRGWCGFIRPVPRNGRRGFFDVAIRGHGVGIRARVADERR